MESVLLRPNLTLCFKESQQFVVHFVLRNLSFDLRTDLLVYSFGGAFNRPCDGIWLRHINRMAARDLDDRRTRALGHEALRPRRAQLVLRSNQLPTRLWS